MIIDAFIDCFWLVATACVKLVVPIIAIVILFKILHYFIIKGE